MLQYNTAGHRRHIPKSKGRPAMEDASQRLDDAFKMACTEAMHMLILARGGSAYLRGLVEAERKEGGR